MGQYYLVVNLDKKQYLHPHRFGDGLKLMEFGMSGRGTMAGLAVLLSNGNGQGGGDIRSADPLVGSWAGDRIEVTGDYAAAVDGDPDGRCLFSVAKEEYEDISGKVRKVFEEAGEDISPSL